MRRSFPVLIGAGIATACVCSTLGLAVILAPETLPEPATGVAPGSRHTPVAQPPAEPERRAVDASEPVADRASGHLDFDASVDHLVALGVAMWSALEASDASAPEPSEAVRAQNAAAESCLERVHAAHPHAAELALDRLTRLDGTGGSVECRVRRHVLERILRDALALRHTVLQRDGPRAPLDALVSAMLACVPQSAGLANGLGALLADQPYLGPAHERVVLELADLVTEAPFLAPVVARLLRTLWHNLEASGAQSSARLLGLAMLFVEDGNPSRRLAALQQLVRDPRYRDFAVAHVVRAGDRDAARELAQTASAELPPADALVVLQALDEAGGDDLLGSWLLLGTRDGDLLARHYEQVLADGVRPKLRASLVTGACARGDAAALAVAGVAFRHDPDPEVRLRALYALAGHPDATIAENALHAALDDPRGTTDAGWVASVALALRNLAATGATNELARIGRRLELHPLLGDAERAELRRLLGEHLPAGRGSGGPR